MTNHVNGVRTGISLSRWVALLDALRIDMHEHQRRKSLSHKGASSYLALQFLCLCLGSRGAQQARLQLLEYLGAVHEHVPILAEGVGGKLADLGWCQAWAASEADPSASVCGAALASAQERLLRSAVEGESTAFGTVQLCQDFEMVALGVLEVCHSASCCGPVAIAATLQDGLKITGAPCRLSGHRARRCMWKPSAHTRGLHRGPTASSTRSDQ
eukprot:SAG25_NODE_1021_length_4261_cov_5.098624_5_plen_214_part_00